MQALVRSSLVVLSVAGVAAMEVAAQCSSTPATTGRPLSPGQPLTMGPDIVPAVPTPKTGAASTPAARTPTPSVPTPAAHTGPRTPTGNSRAAKTAGRAALGVDYTTWEYWWQFNRHAYLQLRDASARAPRTGSDEFFMGSSRHAEAGTSLRPSDAQRIGIVLPEILKSLDRPDRNSTTPAALLALARIGVAHSDTRVLEKIRARLDSELGAVREAATLALGVCKLPAAIPDLLELSADSAAGRKLCGQSEVDGRLRAYACYALGLAASGADLDQKRSALEGLARVLDDSSLHAEITVAAIEGIGLLRPDPTRRSYNSWKLLNDCVTTLWAFYGDTRATGDDLARAHVPTAIAELLGRGHPFAGKYKRAFAAELQGSSARRGLISQSAAIALGLLCQPSETDYSEALHRYYQRGKDQQTRFFSLMALGQIGGNDNRNTLLTELDRGNKATEKPWAAMALGVLAHGTRQRGVDVTIGRALHRELHGTKNDQSRSAFAVALGLAGYTQAAEDLTELLRTHANRDEFAGYLCVGLGLMDALGSAPQITSLAQASTNRPIRLVQSSLALAEMGDRDVAETLATTLSQSSPNMATLSSMATALAFVGDRRSIDALVEVHRDPSTTEWGRGYAMAALGAIAEPSSSPWYAELSINLNYRAGVSTLSDGHRGVLDAL